ncbi:MAG: hypothetical protein LBV72_00725 [Tannerella sp.]|nr:hypothetical protein [Tannerella sp.]
MELPVFANAKQFLALSDDEIISLYPHAKHFVYKKGLHIEIRFSNYTLTCLTDEYGKCRYCMVFFDTDDCTNVYLHLCKQKYTINACQWLYHSMVIDYYEGADDTSPSFFTVTEFRFFHRSLSMIN